ncbi:MAG: SDR family oxidoreductase [Chloroflexi bacterium]|nr:SDR family oxidoreductase [Chloroflexota bacterium]
MKHVVITGAATGIGYATARELIEHGYHVFGNVRKTADAERLQTEWGENFTPLVFDVTNAAAIEAAADQVEDALGEANLFGLINNAGIAVSGPLMHLPVEELRQQFDVNLFGLMAVTQAFLPLLGAYAESSDVPGRIINLSSVSGRIAYPFLGPYAASKHALEGLSDSLRRELTLYGIKVILIEPGSVQTPIWDKAEQVDIQRYADTDYAEILAKMHQTTIDLGRQGLRPEKVAMTIRLALESPRPKARYLLANNYLLGWWLPQKLPTGWFDWLLARSFGLQRK